MFTGIIEQTAEVVGIEQQGTNTDFWVRSVLTPELKIDQSVAHNGVCLTVVAFDQDTYRVTAVAETLDKTNLGYWKKGDIINIERSLRIGDRLDGHLVQGHVDTTGICVFTQQLNGSHLFRFQFDEKYAAFIIEKGSVCINGVSLTVFDVVKNEFTVTIIPYTYEHTNFHQVQTGSIVNIEFDVLGKYLLRQKSLQS